MAQQVVNQSAGVIIGSTNLDINSAMTNIEARLNAMGVGELLGLWFQTLFVGLTMDILSICIMLVIHGRMIEIYLVTSVGPIPMATMANNEWRSMGQNYLKSLLALGFQAFLIMVCVGIYAVLIQSIVLSADITSAVWTALSYTVLLCFCLFKTGSMATIGWRVALYADDHRAASRCYGKCGYISRQPAGFCCGRICEH